MTELKRKMTELKPLERQVNRNEIHRNRYMVHKH